MPKKLKLNLLRAYTAVLILVLLIGGVFAGKLLIDRTIAKKTGSTATAQQEGSGSDFKTYEKIYQNIVKTKGTSRAFDQLKSDYERNPYVKSQCHQLTHVIGRSGADKYGDVAKAYAQGDGFCWSGYYHGVMESIVNKIGYDAIPAQANNICASLKKERAYSFDHYNCVHGLGHGFMAIDGDELFNSLKQCDLLTDVWEAESCYGGVFMENIMSEFNSFHDSKYLKPDQPMYPCTDVGDQYKTQCYMMQTSYALKTQAYDFSKVFSLCAAVEGVYRVTCYQSLGRDASGNSISNVESTKSNCLLGKDFEAQSNCIIGAVKDFISYFHDDDQATQLCDSFTVDLQRVCSDTAKDYYKTL